MSKNVVICCDGTANEFATDHTNVLKLCKVLDNQSGRQVAFYHPGLGTIEAVGALTSVARIATKTLGQMFGYGLESDVADIYAFLMQNYEAGDNLYMFGFSRGAYTVRAVASLLHMYGLLPTGNGALIRYAIRMMNATSKQGSKTFDQAQDFRETFRGTPCKPHFVGVWDTVSSVGWVENPLKLPYSANNPDIAIGRHALAIDERRAFFRANLWRPDPPVAGSGPHDMKQVWFPGAHSDVGGGYPEAECGLSKFAFEWMAREAALAGLLVDRARIDEILGRSGSQNAPADANAKMHESLVGAWWLAEVVPKKHWDWQAQTEGRRMNLARRRTLPPVPLVHSSAFDRKGYVTPPGAVKVETPAW